MSQFTFLAADFPDIIGYAATAEGMARSDARASCFYARLALEVAVNWMFENDRSLSAPYETSLAARIHDSTFRGTVGSGRFSSANIIRSLGNAAVHDIRPVAPENAITSVRELFNFTFWLARTYGRTQPNPNLAFRADALPQTRQVAVSTLAQLQEAARSFMAAVAVLEDEKKARLASEEQRSALEAEIAAVRAEIAAIKAANATVPDVHDYDEAATRDTFIDLLLHEAGWALDSHKTASVPLVACQIRRVTALSIMCCGVPMGSRLGSWRRSALERMRERASSRRSSMPTV